GRLPGRGPRPWFGPKSRCARCRGPSRDRPAGWPRPARSAATDSDGCRAGHRPATEGSHSRRHSSLAAVVAAIDIICLDLTDLSKTIQAELWSGQENLEAVNP